MPLQLHQNINLLFLLLVGSFVANIYLSPLDILTILIFSLIIEHLFLYLNPHRTFYFSYATLSSAVGVIVLMYANSLWLYFFALTVGLAQKHFLTIQGKHLFNPSNFALIMVLTFFYQDAHIITGQLGDEVWLSLVVSFIAMIILIRVKRWLIPLSFTLGYLLLQYLLVVSYDPVLVFDSIYRRFYAVTFILFIYFMLTDPSVTPKNWQAQILYALGIALIASLLDRHFGYRVQHLFMAVFLLSPMVVLLQIKMDPLTRFKWGSIILSGIVLLLYSIEMHPPYYIEMNG